MQKSPKNLLFMEIRVLVFYGSSEKPVFERIVNVGIDDMIHFESCVSSLFELFGSKNSVVKFEIRK